MAFDIQFKLIYQGIRDVFRVRSLSTDVLSNLMYSLDDEDIFKLSVFCDILSIWDIGLAGKIYRNHFKSHKYNLNELTSERHWKWGAIVTILIQFFIAYLYRDVFITLINIL